MFNLNTNNKPNSYFLLYLIWHGFVCVCSFFRRKTKTFLTSFNFSTKFQLINVNTSVLMFACLVNPINPYYILLLVSIRLELYFVRVCMYYKVEKAKKRRLEVRRDYMLFSLFRRGLLKPELNKHVHHSHLFKSQLVFFVAKMDPIVFYNSNQMLMQ